MAFDKAYKDATDEEQGEQLEKLENMKRLQELQEREKAEHKLGMEKNERMLAEKREIDLKKEKQLNLPTDSKDEQLELPNIFPSEKIR